MHTALIFQLLLAAWFFFIHFIPLSPLNDIAQFPNTPSWNRVLFLNWLVLLLLIVASYVTGFYGTLLLTIYLGLLMFGHINTWWLPYIFGWPKVFVEEHIDHKATIRFLPERKNHPTPDVAYCVLGTLCLIAFIFSIKDLL